MAFQDFYLLRYYLFNDSNLLNLSFTFSEWNPLDAFYCYAYYGAEGIEKQEVHSDMITPHKCINTMNHVFTFFMPDETLSY